jgi:hypothetical protein
LSEERKKAKMSVFSKTGDLSNIIGSRLPKLVPPTLGSSQEHDVIRFGVSCESLAPRNMPLSGSFAANECTPTTRARLARTVEKLERGPYKRS